MVSIRAYQPSDLDAVYEINCQSTPGVSEETRTALEAIIALPDCHVLTGHKSEVLGFITLIQPGTFAYESPNLRWFEGWKAETGNDLIYVDRIALHQNVRGKGLGEMLYHYAFKTHAARGFITAEVNTIPDNPGSQRFHQRLGFERVGEQTFKPGEKAVAYYARPLASV